MAVDTAPRGERRERGPLIVSFPHVPQVRHERFIVLARSVHDHSGLGRFPWPNATAIFLGRLAAVPVGAPCHAP
jgi:hypothetical protein